MDSNQAARQGVNLYRWKRRVERIEMLLKDKNRKAHHAELKKELELKMAQIVVWESELENAGSEAQEYAAAAAQLRAEGVTTPASLS